MNTVYIGYLPWREVTIGIVATGGILSNVYSLYHHFKRGKGFPKQLYVVLNFLDVSVCLIAFPISIFTLHVSDLFLFLMLIANQISGLWTCILGGARLVAMSRPFYRINKWAFWIISIMLLIIEIIYGVFTIIPEVSKLLATTRYMYLVPNILHILVNLVVTVWTGILLIRKSLAAAGRDQERRNAAFTVFLLSIVFLLTNISAMVLWGLYWFGTYWSSPDLSDCVTPAFRKQKNLCSFSTAAPVRGSDMFYNIIYISVVITVVNAALNPLVILRRYLRSLSSSLIGDYNTDPTEANNVASADQQ